MGVFGVNVPNTPTILPKGRAEYSHAELHQKGAPYCMTIGLPVSVRFAVVPRLTAASVPSKLLLLDVMDTLVADPFFRGFHKAHIDQEYICPSLAR